MHNLNFVEIVKAMLLTDEFIQVQAQDGVGSPGMNSITLTLMVIHLYTPHVSMMALTVLAASQH